MDFHYPWTSDLNFKPYLTNLNDFVGREWMLEDLSYELLKTERRGMLVAAELGFGKSALISHIACSHDKQSSGFPIFEKTTVIHLCKYDSNLTLNPGVFVRNMAGKLSELYPEFGNIINTDSTASSYLFSSKCLEDPNGCFDYVILYPLQKAKIVQRSLMIIIIDALDECIEVGSKNIFSLLRQKIYQLPRNIKFLFTSRNISDIKGNLPPGVSVYQTPLFWKNNLNDIKKYLIKKLENNTVSEQFQEMLSRSGTYDVIEKLAELVGENFLFLVHALDVWIKEGNVNYQPKTVENIYQINVIRILGKNENLINDARSIFEILCASHGSINETLLFNVLNIESERKIYLTRLLSNELSHFVQKSSGKIFFTNGRIADFFSKQNNIENDFYILQKNGHRMLALHWLNYFEKHPSKISLVMIMDMFKHVAGSKNQSLNDQLTGAVRRHLHITTRTFLKHNLAATSNSYDAMLLAIESTHEIDIDERDQDNLTAAYIAAAYGNDKSLVALIENGADLDYQRSQPVLSKILPNQDPIHLSKYTFQWGYNLANIASQNGHADIIELLLKHKVNVCHENSVGLNSFHLAAEHGHISILRMFMSSSKCKWSSSFPTSLYLAAKTGHLHVVKYLLSLNVVDTCVPCSDKMNWIPPKKVRFQSKIPKQKLPYEWDYRNFALKDDRNFFFCESALDIAVQNQHLEIVKVLTNETVNALKCVNARGMTPLITAAAFGRNDIVLYFLERGLSLNDSCKVKEYTRFSSNNKERFSDGRICVNGLTFWHMLAIYASEETMESVYKQNKFNYTWNITDNYGATPFHFLCCNARFSDVKYIQYFDLLSSHMLQRAINGSTPAHSAALCGQYFPLNVFINRYKLPKDIKDNNNKNILHYMAMSDLKYIQTDNLLVIFNNSYDFLIGEQDVDGRTPLHYAAMVGNIFINNRNFDWVISHKPQHYMIENKNNMTVLDILFREMPSIQPQFGRNTIKLIDKTSTSCISDHLFGIPGCLNARIQLLDNFERFAYQVFSNLKNTYLIKKRNVLTYMRVALKKNRFYLILMIKEIFPNIYELICKERVHWFLAQLLKKSSYPNLIVSTFFADLIKQSCKSKQQDDSLWHIFYDKNRKFWPMYLVWNNSAIEKTIINEIEKCNQKGLFDAAVKGGNRVVLAILIFHDQAHLFINSMLNTPLNNLYLAPCVDASSRYLMPRQFFIDKMKKEEHVDMIPYSHSLVWKTITMQLEIKTPCSENKANLSFEHIAAAKGIPFLSSENQSDHGEDIFFNCHHEHFSTPHMLAYFFNHSWSYERNVRVNKNTFYSNHYVSLYFKTLMDFRTFIFPKNSAAWKCSRYTHQINRLSLKKLVCRANLETEICSIISELYAMDWRLVYHMYSFNKIKKYVDHKWKYPFDFINFIQHVRKRCDVSKRSRFSSYMSYIYNANQTIYSSCNVQIESGQSRVCLENISFLNKQRKYVNYQIQSILQMYFPLAYLIYDKFIVKLPDLAQKNTMEIIQIMHAYGSVPFFHNHPLYDYWNELYSPISNPFRTMTESILTSNVSEILSWIREENYFDRSSIKAVKQKHIHSNPLAVYHLKKHDSSN